MCSLDGKKATEISTFDIAKWVIIFSFSVIGLLGFVAIMAIAMDSKGEKVSAIKDIISILLPVIGAWAGTVIAYYFSRENFESATNSTKFLVQQLTPTEILQKILFKEVMIPIENATKFILNKDESEILVQRDILTFLDKEDKNRLPILNNNGKIMFMLHRSLIDKYIIKVSSQGIEIDDISLADLLKDPEFEKISKGSFSTVYKDATLAEAKSMMEKDSNCLDVFSTDNGGKDGKVIGWVTNVIILLHSKAV